MQKEMLLLVGLITALLLFTAATLAMEPDGHTALAAGDEMLVHTGPTLGGVMVHVYYDFTIALGFLFLGLKVKRGQAAGFFYVMSALSFIGFLSLINMRELMWIVPIVNSIRSLLVVLIIAALIKKPTNLDLLRGVKITK